MENAANVEVGTTATVNNLPAGTYTLTVKDDCFTRTCTVTIVSPPCGGHIFPTSTSCCTFSNGSALELTEICYTAGSGNISNATPGVFFYYAKITAPSTSFSVDVVQTHNNDLTKIKLFSLHQDQIILWNPDCGKASTGTQMTVGQGRATVYGAIIGAIYIISVKYNSKSIIGSNYAGAAPNVVYTFKSQINGIDVAGSAGSVTAKPNCNSAFVSPGTCPAPPPIQPLTSNSVNNNNSIFEDKLSVIPNPASTSVNITFNCEIENKSTIFISDLSGKIISKTNYESVKGLNNTSINLDNIANGIYMISVKTNTRQLTERLIIIK